VTRPNTYLIRMAIFLVAVLVVAAMLSPVLLGAYANNPILNSFILLVLLIGIAWNLRQVLRLSPEVAWVETFQNARPRIASLPSPKLLAPMASMLASRETHSRTDQARFTLSASAMRSVLDGIASRLDESRELSRYMTGLMIFLGLLGTFWGQREVDLGGRVLHLIAVDHVLQRARGVDQADRGGALAGRPVAEHGPERDDPRAAGHEQQGAAQSLLPDEITADRPPELKLVARPELPDQVGRDLPVLQALDRQSQP
jgi:hypothetical protein